MHINFPVFFGAIEDKIIEIDGRKYVKCIRLQLSFENYQEIN